MKFILHKTAKAIVSVAHGHILMAEIMVISAWQS